ncbi:MAG: glycosyltransferase, partial [Methylocystis sp.]|nr:glycosyltransferase [Methylocystis sp.]
MIETISVVMAAHNGASQLRATMDSVLAQQGVDFEFVVVDDGSTDETLVILEEYAARDNRCLLYTSPSPRD